MTDERLRITLEGKYLKLISNTTDKVLLTTMWGGIEDILIHSNYFQTNDQDRLNAEIDENLAMPNETLMIEMIVASPSLSQAVIELLTETTEE